MGVTTMHRMCPKSPWIYAAAYALLASAWILFTDLALDQRSGAREWSFNADVAKGLLFVVVTSWMLFLVLREFACRVRQKELELREQEDRWRQVLDGVGDGLWDWQVGTGEVYYAPRLEMMLGYSPGTFRRHVDEWSARVHPDDIEAVRAAVQRCFSGERQVYETEHRVRRSDGSYCWVLDRGVVIQRDEQGAPVRMVGTHSDISARKAMEQQLRDSAEHYHAMFKANPIPMWVYDAETLQFLAVNHAAVRKYGYTREQFLGMTLRDLRPSEDLPVLAHVTQAPRPALQTTGPARHRRADGETILVETDSHEIVWGGRPARVAVLRDVTAQVQAAVAVQESEQKFRAIFESANDAIFTADEHYRITSCNPRGLDLLRVRAEEITGRRIPEFFPERQPDGVNSIRKAISRLRRVWEGRVEPFEWTLQRPDGSTLAAEITLSGLEHGGRRSIVVVVRDITERMRATRELQLLHAALQATPAGIVVTDAKGRIEWVNPAFTEMTGYSAAEVVGQNPRILRSGQHESLFYQGLWETIVHGEVWSGELQNRRKNGSLYFEHMTIAPVRNSAGEITNFVAIKDDVTNERQLEQQLARSQRLESVGMLASGIAHDLNNVLTPILLSAELMRAENLSPQSIARLDLVAQAAQRGANIVKQVLTFARGVEGERTVVQPRYLLKEVAQLAEETFPRSIEVRTESGKDVPAVRGDVTQLHQVLLNLAVNARDAMPQGGRLTLGVRRAIVDELRARASSRLTPGEYVELSVTDTGTGIADEVLEHMFEPFFTTKPRGKGTGLGLSTVYGIVRSHGGAVEVETQLGRGTTFRVLLPPVPVEREAPSGGEKTEAKIGQGRRVLIVDDEQPIRVVLEQVLRRHGFETVTAMDGLQALQLFRLRPESFDAAIVDLMMPRMRGTVLIRELRALSPDLHIIYSSGFTGGEDLAGEVAELPQLGVTSFLAKPYREEELVQKLQELFESVPTGSGKKKV